MSIISIYSWKEMDNFELILAFYLFYLMYVIVANTNYKQRTRRWWIKPINLKRNTVGYFATTYLKLKETDPEEFFKHTRMNRSLYDCLLNLVQEDLTKHSIRRPIDFECRLALTLSYLSQGVSQQYLSWSFHMGKSTVREIILDTCKIIWKVLSPIYVSPPTTEDYKRIAKDFECLWNMPNCVGAVDGKYIVIECPPNSGSLYYDHKGNFSIVLLASCDARYSFTHVDVGAYGSQSDGGILQQSAMGTALFKNTLPLPTDSVLNNSEEMFPYYFVGDAAFPLKTNLMRPYPGRLLDDRKNIFNYRLSRARRIIENSFGILVARWRVLRTKIHALPDNVVHIVLATIALHNYIQLNSASANSYCPPNFVDWEDANGVLHLGQWREEVSALRSTRIGSNNATKQAFHLRDILANYFMGAGSVPFQYNRDSM